MSDSRLKQLLSMLSENELDSFLRFAVAKEYEGQGNLQKALEYYLKLLQDDPDYIGTYYHLGKLYEQLDESDWAVEIYNKGLATARAQGDRHAYNELAAARLEWVDEEE